MCMGLGCNAAGVVGCRIIDSPREKLISILTNAFMPCNGRFPFLITVSMVFIGSYFAGAFSSIISALCVLGIIILGVIMTLLISKLLSKTILKGVPSSFILELPPYRKPQIGKVLIRSIFDRTLFVLRKSNSSSGTCWNYNMAICKHKYRRNKHTKFCSKFSKSICKTNGARWLHTNSIFTRATSK